MNKLLIYGAYGYSAKLISERLKENDISPVLAGRDETKLHNVAEYFNCEYEVFDLNDENTLKEKLRDFHTVLNCAGPFIHTAEKFFKACLAANTNYLDITGEIPVLEKAWEYNEEAEEKGITILPALGFDVIPTDCLSKRLKEKLPDANYLKLGFENIGGKTSRGTGLTTLEMVDSNSKIRKNGKIVEVPLGELTHTIESDKIKFSGISIPWGDISSAYHSTGIPNIEVYMGLPSALFATRRLFPVAKDILNIRVIKDFLQKQIKEKKNGPTEYERQTASMIVWGKVSNEKGEEIFEVYKFLEGYELTKRGAAEAVIKVLNNEAPKGTLTPSLAFGHRFMDKFVVEKLV